MKYAGGLSLMAGTVAALFMAACNGGNQLNSDWIQPAPAPTSTATPAPSATPAPKPTTTPSPTPTGSDLYTGPAEVEKYILKFIDDAKIQGVDVLPDMKNPKLEIQLASLSSYGSSVIGLCESGTDMRRVTFSPSFWDSVDETQRELLAHHELGHCVLYRAHRTDLLSSGEYASIMYPIIMSDSTYLNNYAYYQQELFTQTELSQQAAIGIQTHICNYGDL